MDLGDEKTEPYPDDSMRIDTREDWDSSTRWKMGIAASLIVILCTAFAGLMVSMRDELREIGHRLDMVSLQIQSLNEVKKDVADIRDASQRNADAITQIRATRFTREEAEKLRVRVRALEMKKR